MTLKEKFLEIDVTNTYDHIANDSVKIADDYAVEFADWLILKCDFKRHGIFEYIGEEYSNKELLQIFKNQRGL